MEIFQNSKPYKNMRYETAGDYLYRPGIDLFRFMIADMPTDYQMLVFIHEYVEAILCWREGIKEEDISNFDKMFEKERGSGLHSEDAEPGDDKRAPYFKQHQIATRYEKKLCKDMGIRWVDYDDAIMNLE